MRNTVLDEKKYNSWYFNPNLAFFCEVSVSSRAVRSSGGRVVKLLACGARGPGLDPRPRHLDFQRLVISCFQVEIWLKDR